MTETTLVRIFARSHILLEMCRRFLSGNAFPSSTVSFNTNEKLSTDTFFEIVKPQIIINSPISHLQHNVGSFWVKSSVGTGEGSEYFTRVHPGKTMVKPWKSHGKIKVACKNYVTTIKHEHLISKGSETTQRTRR